MAERRTVNWYELDKVIGGLETDIEHEIRVQREAIPLIFVPGIMGTRLRRAGTDPNQRRKRGVVLSKLDAIQRAQTRSNESNDGARP